MIGGGCASTSLPVSMESRDVSTALSPVPERVTPSEAWRRAEAYAAAHPDCEVFVGSGDSMLPLYADRTVLVVQHLKVSALRRGMTAIFTGDQGRLVAHTLLEPTERGWRAIGVGNRAPDETLVRRDNMVGVVIKAYAPARPAALVAMADAQ